MELKSQELCIFLSVLTLPTLPLPQLSEYKVNFGTITCVGIHLIIIIGLLQAPTDTIAEAVGVDGIIVSWSPPFTLEGVPILHYSVYTTSQGVSEQRNTTETHITLERPCASTTYQISAWNEVGEGNATRKGETN